MKGVDVRAALRTLVIVLSSALFTVPRATSGEAIGASPAALDFGNQLVGTTSPAVTVTVTNTGTIAVSVTSVATAPPFAVSGFSGPLTLSPGQQLPLAVTFAPKSAAVANGTLSIVAGGSSATVALSGSATTVAAPVSVTPASLSFGNQTVGSSSPQVLITVTDTGTAKVSIKAAGFSGPFPGSGFAGQLTLSPGSQFHYPVAFSPTATGAAAGNFGILYPNISPSFVALSGTGTAVTSLTVTTQSPLPQATQNAPYLAVLTASGGTPPYSWALDPSSTLPSGMNFSSSNGTTNISASSVTAAIGSFSFIVDVTDSSSPPNTAAATLHVAVKIAPSDPSKKANCNQISYGSPPFVPMVDMGSATFQGQSGGLYGNGSNTDPTAHLNAGVNLAQAIQPLDSNGNPSSTGQYVLLSIGMSNARDEFKLFTADALSDSSLNPRMVIVNGAQSGFGADSVANYSSVYWSNLDTILGQAGVNAKQVVAAWVEETNAGTSASEPFSQFTTHLQADLESIAQNLLKKFPNIKLAYCATRSYGGYASTTQSPEPFAYYTAYAARAAILDQINGVCSMNFDPTQCNGVVTAPWVAWGAYFWANGMSPRSDGLVWACQDFDSDGTHPSEDGRQKAGTMLLSFFASDPTATPWFLAH